MFPTPRCLGGLLWKNPFRLSATRKINQRRRLRAVDSVIAAVASTGVKTRSLEVALRLPTERQMSPRDKYTAFSRTLNVRGEYRKSIHRVPKFTKVTCRVSPAGF